MLPIEKCMQTLRVLISSGDIHAISLAKTAVDDFLAAHEDPNRQIGALNVLDAELVALRQKADGSSAAFVDTLLEYLDKKMATLRIKS